MKILLTGGTGFIGQHLLEELKDDDLSVLVLSRKDKPVFWCTSRKFETVKGDLADAGSLERIFSGVDAVVHLAAELKEEKLFESTNIKGAENIISLSARNGVRKIVHLSSVGVVGMQFSSKRVLVNENFPCSPKNDYERTKLRSEQLFLGSRERNKTAVHVLRPTNVFGERHPRRALEGFFTRVKKGSNFPSAQAAMVNYVYVKDVAYAIRYCIMNNDLPPVMNVGPALLFEDFVRAAATRVGSASRVKVLPSALLKAGEFIGELCSQRLGIAMRSLMNKVEYDDSLLKKYPGYRYGIEKGIDATASYYGM
ncbi:MAG TPA: NAD(P)-dependent oxidoreductase [Bacteroidia bacterium]|jgi:nucleoside-diphosphate-sugar epimerase